MQKYFSLSGLALIVACGGSQPRDNTDSDSGRRTDMGQVDMYSCPPYSGEKGDMSIPKDCDAGTDSSEKRDGNLKDAVNDMGSSDGNNDMGSDGPGDMGPPDEGVTYPIARLNCEERNDAGLCIHRMRTFIGYDFDASPSEAAPGRTLVLYRIYVNVPASPVYFESETSNVRVTYSRTSEERGFPEGFPAELEVIDNLGDFDREEIRNIVTD